MRRGVLHDLIVQLVPVLGGIRVVAVDITLKRTTGTHRSQGRPLQGMPGTAVWATTSREARRTPDPPRTAPRQHACATKAESDRLRPDDGDLRQVHLHLHLRADMGLSVLVQTADRVLAERAQVRDPARAAPPTHDCL